MCYNTRVNYNCHKLVSPIIHYVLYCSIHYTMYTTVSEIYIQPTLEEITSRDLVPLCVTST